MIFPNGRGELPSQAQNVGLYPGTLQQELAGRYPRVQGLRIFKTSRQSSQGAGFPQNSQKITIDRPTILYPLGATTGNSGANNVVASTIQNWVYAIPAERNDPGAGHWDTTKYRAALISVNAGVLYLPNAGDYYIYYPDTAAEFFLVIDASDPVQAYRYLNEPGNHTFTIHANDRTVLYSEAVTLTTKAGVPGFLETLAANSVGLGGNRNRKCAWIQNTGTTNIRLGFGTSSVPTYTEQDPPAEDVVIVARGIRLAPDEIFEVNSTNIFLDGIFVVPEEGGVWLYNAVDDNYDVVTPAEDITFAVWESI